MALRDVGSFPTRATRLGPTCSQTRTRITPGSAEMRPSRVSSSLSQGYVANYPANHAMPYQATMQRINQDAFSRDSARHKF